MRDHIIHFIVKDWKKFLKIYDELQGRDVEEQTNFYLNQFGDLYRKPKESYCYPIGKGSDRHKIIRFLARNADYQETSLISAELNSKSEQLIRTEIGKIRNNIAKFLKINGKEFIEGKKESGYRINPKFTITIQDE